MNLPLFQSLAALFSEITEGADTAGGAFILNSGDVGLLRALEALPATDASKRLSGGATVAAHAQHVRFGLSLFNRWARDGGNPFADAKWDEAWKTAVVDDAEWSEILGGLKDESRHWRDHLGTPRALHEVELRGVIASIAHTAYHLGAIRQIAAATRGPREGTFAS
jgi:hypothetical protein